VKLHQTNQQFSSYRQFSDQKYENGSHDQRSKQAVRKGGILD